MFFNACRATADIRICQQILYITIFQQALQSLYVPKLDDGLARLVP